MEKKPILAYVLVPLLLLSVASTSTYVAAQEDISVPPSFGTTPAPEEEATTTAENATGPADYVRARVQLFGIQPNGSDIVTWITVPSEHATGAGSINVTELEASNNITDDGMGEMFMALPNVTSAVNQQIQACALDVVVLTAKCDNAFTSNATQSTVLQILLGEPAKAAMQ